MITYSNIVEKDLDDVTALYEKYLNSGSYIRDSIRKEFYTNGYLGFKACDGDRIVGFFTAQDGICFTYPHPAMEREIREFAGDRKIYTPDGMLVREEYRGNGVARGMVRMMGEALREKKVELVLLELWVYPDGTVPAQRPLVWLGNMVYQKEIPMFYEELGNYGIRCPICGEGCTCGALVELVEIM